MLKILHSKFQTAIPSQMRASCLKCFMLLCLTFMAVCRAIAQPQPVVASRPRIFLDPATKTNLLAKKNANDADWQAVLAQANKYITGTVIPWNPTSASDAQYYSTNDVFYSYCGSSWEEAAMTLGLAHQLTKTNLAGGSNATAYSNMLLQFADVIVKGYNDYPPNANGVNIFQFNTAYATRHVGKTIAVIYDWCYDELGETRRAAMRKVMKDWFNYMSSAPNTVFQLQDQPTGNYYIGQLICAGYMGLAIAGDDPLSQKMIDFARQRITGDPGTLNPDTRNSGESANNYFTQSVKGGLPTYASQAYLGPTNIVGAPQKDGMQNQGWSYGGESIMFLTDYIFAVKSATGEDMLQTDPSLRTFFAKTSETLVHAYTPNRFQIDNANDYGSFIGSVATYALPLRLTALLDGSPEGANLEYFYKHQLQPVNLSSGNTGYQILNWEKFFFNKTRTSTPFTYKPYYPIPTTNTYNSIAINTGMHRYYLRTDWGANATWAVVNMGAAGYDAHNHNNAGHFKIIRGDSHEGDDQVLVAANEVPHDAGNGIDGPSNYSYATSFSNTLFINDFHTYSVPYQDFPGTVGGQSSLGYDEPTAEEQNDKFSYFRSDFTSAYFSGWSDPDTSKRSIKYYYRSFLFLRNSNVFVVYDKFQAKNSTSENGQYPKHLRWHFLQPPVVNGNNITETVDNSKLYIHTVIPAALNIATVDESNNPDNTFGPNYNYVFNTATWRTEVSVPNNPLRQDIVTVLQPGAKAGSTEMKTTAIQTNQNNMEGSIIAANGNTEVVLFNNSIVKYPAPITATSYAYSGSLTATHSLCGLDPNQKYHFTYTAGVVTVTKTSDGDITASPAGVLSFQIQPAATAQTITFPALQPVKFSNVDIAPDATSTNTTIPITYTSSNAAVATIAGGNIHLVGAGTAVITASQAGNDTYSAAADVQRTLTVSQNTQTIVFNKITWVYGDADYAPAIASSGLPLIYTSANPTIASIVNNQVHILKSGSAYITAKQAGDANYAPRTVTQLITIGKASQYITVQAPAPIKLGATDLNLNASVSSGLALTYKSSKTSVATIVNGKVHPVAIGTTTITISQAGNTGYEPTTTTVNVKVVSAQTITFNQTAFHYGDADFSPATASSGLPVTYSSANPTIASIVNGKVHILKVGSAYIIATQAGNASYAPAIQVTQLITIAKGIQTFAIKPITGKFYGGPDFDPGVISSSGLKVIYTIPDTSTAKVINNKIHIIAAGKTTVTVSQEGNSNFEPLTSGPLPVTILRVQVTVTADDQIRTTAQANPVFTGSYSGFVNGESELNLTKKATFTTTATAASAPGDYAISAKTVAVDPNYVFVYVNGTLKITPPVLATAVPNGTANSLNDAAPDEFTTDAPKVHSAMSPNGDGINDVLLIDNIQNYPDNKVTLIDKNGTGIYEATGYNNAGKAFDGHANGNHKMQIPGTYYYLLQYNDHGVQKRLTGFFLIKY